MLSADLIFIIHAELEAIMQLDPSLCYPHRHAVRDADLAVGWLNRILASARRIAFGATSMK